MKLLNKLRYFPAAMLLVLVFTSCDDDFSTIGGELVGGQFGSLPLYEAGVVAYNKTLYPVQTNNLSAHLLGVYNEPVYGQQIANVLTQLSLPDNGANPNFGNEPRLDSVVLTLPYFSTRITGEGTEDATYRLDSIYGNAPYRLSITRSNYFLNDLDPEANFENRQRYYSNQGSLFESNLTGDPIYVDESFVPSNSEVSFRQQNATGEIDTVTVSPRMRINLPVQFFEDNILNKEGSVELSNNNNFRNFIRGLYFKAEPVNNNGNMLLLNFRDNDAGITLYYTNTVDDEDRQNTYRINFGDNIVNTYSQELPTQIATEIEDSNDPPGAENLFLKGGEGSMAIIKLFEDEAELEDLRSKDWLINEANLTFYVNQEMVPGGEHEPLRLYLYNLSNNELLIDYSSDPTASAVPSRAYISHAPPLVRGEDGNGIFYKIRITNHIRRILNMGGENVRLGLVVIQNIQSVSNAAVRTPAGEVDGVSRIPSGAVNTPKGTVLHGNLSPNAAKRLKLDIYYTGTN